MASSTKPNLTAVATPALTDIVSVRQSGDARDKRETLTQVRSVVAPDATTSAKGLVELATDGEVAAGVAVQGNDGRLGRVPATSFLAANATNATATMAASGLTVPVTSGRKYIFRAVLLCQDSEDADGYAFDFDTSAAATNFRAFAVVTDTVSAGLLQVSITALATDINGAGSSVIQVIVEGSYEPSASGNLLIRFAQNAHTTGTLTLFRGSYLMRWDIT